MVRKLYVDMMSQPARALVVFCRATGIDVELVLLNISKGEHLRPEYKAINPLGKIPCLEEDGFFLPESAAILRYLANTNTVPEHWYPADFRKRAKVDCALDWHHSNVRRGCAGLVFNRVLAEKLDGKRGNPALAEQSQKILVTSLQLLESCWLKDTPFVSGSSICVADLLMVTELEMLRVLVGATEGPNMEELLEPFPKVRAWMKLVAETTAPHYEQAMAVLLKVSAAFARRKAREQGKL